MMQRSESPRRNGWCKKLLELAAVVLVVFWVHALPAQEFKNPQEPVRVMYLVESLYVKDGILFLGQQTLPTPKGESSLVRAMGFTADGKHVRPPDPGHAFGANNAFGKPKPKHPPALTTHLWGARLNKSTIFIHYSDLARNVQNPPKELGEVQFVGGTVFFRIELINKPAEPLRRDYKYWKKRTEAILKELKELVKAHPNKFTQEWLKNIPKSGSKQKTSANGKVAKADNDRICKIELLFEYKKVLFLTSTTLFTENKKKDVLRVVGFDESGNYVPQPDRPPDPRFKRIKINTFPIRKVRDPPPKPPLASRSYRYGVSMSGSGIILAFNFDFAQTLTACPEKVGDVRFNVWQKMLFRIERVNKPVEPLRQDYTYWKKRTAEILTEVRKTANSQETPKLQREALQRWLNKISMLKPKPKSQNPATQMQ